MNIVLAIDCADKLLKTKSIVIKFYVFPAFLFARDLWNVM